MLRSIFGFEFAYQTRGAAFFAITLLFFLLTFGAMTLDELQIGSSESVNINSPMVAFQIITVMVSVGLFIPVVFLSSGLIRDIGFKTEETFRSTPVGDRTMMLGRFLGGMAAVWLCFLSVPAGFLLGSVMPWLDQEQIGPLYIGPVLQMTFTLGLLNLFIAGTIMFTVANLTRSMMATWVALVALFVGLGIGASLSTEMESRTLAALIEPLGINAASEQVRFFTPAERNTEAPDLKGEFLTNRIIWVGISLAILALNLLAPRGIRRPGFLKSKKVSKSPAAAALKQVSLPRVEPAPLYTSNWQQFSKRVRFETFGILRSVAFWIVVGLSLLNAGFALLNLGNMYGSSSHPLTRLAIDALLGSFTFVPIVVAVYYSAELIWRERGFRFNDIIEATPTPSWVFMGAKFAAVAVVLVLIAVAATVTAVVTQAFRGYTVFELDQYALRLFVSFVVEFLILTVLAMFLQVLANNKWLGMGLFLAYFVFRLVMGNLGFDHVLYNPGSGINLDYSDMNGYGLSDYKTGWMSLYWLLFSVLLGLLTFALWDRGQLDPILSRLKRLPSRYSRNTAMASVVVLVAFAGVGSFIFYNTNVLNTYQNQDSFEDRAEAYERRWRYAEFQPQPSLTSVELDVDLYPQERRYTAEVDYVLENRTEAPLTEVHVDYGWGTDVLSQSIEGASLKEADEDDLHYVFAFEPALQPGESRAMTAKVAQTNPGFPNTGSSSTVRRNGTFFNNTQSLPQIGWGQTKILSDRAERRKRGLQEDERVPKLEDERYWNRNFLGGSGWIDFEARITTDADQIAIAPGYLVSEETNGDRRTFHYRQDVPIQDFYSVQSADFEVAEDTWKAPEGMDDVALQIFYDSSHPFNIDVMMKALKLSLSRYTEAFAPFQYRQMRIQEFPYGSFAQSFPNTVPYSENIGFIIDLTKENAIDPVTYVTAHEVAHQWFGHQLSASQLQGASMLSETFSQYGALLVMEDVYGKEHMRRFLAYELDRYLSGRASEPLQELPLYRVEAQGYIHYQKGGLVMYLLRDQLGEEVVNRSIARMIDEWAYKSDPYPRSVDYLEILREEAGPEHDDLITDLFERIVLYDVEAASASATERQDGRWDVTVTVDATKLVADGEGNETEEPFAMEVDLGVFSEHPKDVKDGDEHIILFDRVDLESGERTFTVTVDERPAHIGVDPYNKLIDRLPDNNIVRVGTVSEGGPDAAL
jgi:hypothetical protein